ncbi:MAG: class I SAM-dependent methyltransferase [Chloroflexi bacterium]|nr:class I SAM-dependent methyltransferase [Chloroflexota bacterium]
MAQLTAQRTAGQQAAFLLPYLKPGTRLLDCGCGPGTITIGLAEAVAPGEVVGIDIGAPQIEVARANAAQKGTPNVRFQVGDILKLPFEDNSFDVAYANNVIMYFGDSPDQALKEMRRVLRPGGLIGIRNPGGGYVLNPEGGPVQQANAILTNVWNHTGQVLPGSGRKAKAYLRRAGFVRCEGFADCEFYGSPEAIQKMAETEAVRVRGYTRAVELGLTDEATLERLAQEILEWGKDADAFWSRICCSAIGWKEG